MWFETVSLPLKNNNTMNYFSSDFKLGILGGGQLGKMMLTETRKFDIQTYIVDPSAEAPCQFGATKFFQGSLNDYQTVIDLGNQVDVLTIEIETLTWKLWKPWKTK